MKIMTKKFLVAMLRSEDLIISASLTQDFCSSSRRRNRRIAGYATVFTTQKTDKKTSQEADIIKSSLLTNPVFNFVRFSSIFRNTINSEPETWTSSV